jgi:hypothetical protein
VTNPVEVRPVVLEVLDRLESDRDVELERRLPRLQICLDERAPQVLADIDDRCIAIDAVIGHVAVCVEKQRAVPDPAGGVDDDVARTQETRGEGRVNLVSGRCTPEHLRSDALDPAQPNSSRVVRKPSTARQPNGWKSQRRSHESRDPRA